MPGFDGTGPIGSGPMTGRGGGYCMSYVSPGMMFNQGFCRSGGRGRRNWYYAVGLPRWAGLAPGAALSIPVCAPPLNSEHELNYLKGLAAYQKEILEQIENQINELENKE